MQEYTIIPIFVFFFSSRRRHTRSYGDWSSDVCSSDLEVERLLKRAGALDPKLALAPFRLGALYFDQRRYAEAARALQEAIRLQPDLAEARYRLAQVYLRTGEKALAERELEAFRKLGDQQATPAPPK